MALAFSQSQPQARRPFGTVDYVEGSVSITRANRVLGETNFGDEVFPDDMIKTENDGLVIIKLDRTTGMNGDLTVRSGSSIYLRFEPHATSPRSTIEVITGQIGSKVSRLAGSPTLQVRNESTVMGVRGTEFGFVTAPTGSVLVYCTEGNVACSSDDVNLNIPAGQGAEQVPGQRLRLLPVAISNARDFENRWFSDQIEAFRANAPRALADFARRYEQLHSEFYTAFEPFQSSEILARWMQEDRSGAALGSPNSPALMRDKREMITHIARLRRNLFIFERIYLRIDQLADIILGTAIENQEIRPGLTAGAFLRRVRSDAPALTRHVSLYRYAETLYAIRNEGRLPTDMSDDDFFGSSDF
ncbi:MAG: hypothetical protein A2004_11155 [Spirochaetes bacterium GWC1_61_12]|nr:MAG: hypothetical protein A2004_11155 [Spirochaetes bacterium GWC1_61_12]OHD58609.1 MAG: hypothetical protein A2Y32_04660 [Spirochaetes bacterium GWF1_60_12]